jgi:hypothetical protein
MSCAVAMTARARPSRLRGGAVATDPTPIPGVTPVSDEVDKIIPLDTRFLGVVIQRGDPVDPALR